MSLKKFTQRQLIISLIRDDLVHSKLIDGLDKLGLNSDSYLLYLSQTIFQLLGFPNDDRAEEDFVYYLHLRKRARYINLKSNQHIDQLSREIYWDIYFRGAKWREGKKKPSQK